MIAMVDYLTQKKIKKIIKLFAYIKFFSYLCNANKTKEYENN